MKFAQPVWLVILLILLPFLVWVLHYFHRVRLHTLKSFASEHLMETLTANISYFRRDIKKWLLLTGISLCLFALARPQFGFRWEEVRRKGIDILFAVDTSRSMLAEDVNPNRLARAKMAVLDLVSKLKGDRIGIIAFAGTSFLQCPLTLDYDAFHQSLEALDTSVIPQGGTDIASAIKEAEQAFSLGHPSHKILILMTDGEDLEANGIAASKNAADHGMKIFTVGVGTSTGELIPVRNSSGGVEFLKDDKGQVVKSRLDESTLKKIAEVTGGFYEPLGQQGQGLEKVYDQGLASIPKQELSSKMNKVYMDRFQWPLAFAIFCLTIEMLLSDRKRSSKFQVLSSKFYFRKKVKAVFSIILLSIILHPLLLCASPQAAEKAYRQGKFSEAVREYKEASEKNPKNPELQFNCGTASYKNGNLDNAITSFQKALQTDNLSLQQQVFYNLGNTHYRLGEKTEKENPQKTIEVWQQALQDYQNALKLRPNDADAQFNDEFVKKKLEELKQKQPQENKKDKEQQEKNSQEPSSSNPPNKENEEKKQSNRENKTTEKQPPENQSTQKENHQNKARNNQQAPQPQNQKSDGQEKEQQEKEQELPRLTGQMNKEEARALLDSLKDNEKKMPVVLSKPEGEDKVKRDW